MMKHVNIKNCKLSETPSGEKFQVIVGRHEKHGSTKNHTIAIVEIAVDCNSEMHFHKEREESYYIISGFGTAQIAENKIEIQSGDLIYAPPFHKHQFFNNGPEPLRYMVITSPAWVPEDSWT